MLEKTDGRPVAGSHNEELQMACEGCALRPAVIAIVLWGSASIGYLRAPINWAERIVATVAAFLLVVAIPWTDEAGFALAAAFVGWHWLRSRAVKRTAGA